MSIAYLQPTYAKVFIDATLERNPEWLALKGRLAAAALLGVVETISYCSLHVLFSLASFPLTMGYVDVFPRRAAHYAARSWGAAAAARVAAGTVLGLTDPTTTQEQAIAAGKKLQGDLLTNFEASLAQEADYILKRKQVHRSSKYNYPDCFRAKQAKFLVARHEYAQKIVSPEQPNHWYDAIRKIEYQIYCSTITQRKKLWEISIDPYHLACQKAEKCKNKILAFARQVGQDDRAAKICLEALSQAKLNFTKRPRHTFLDIAVEEVQKTPAKIASFLAHLKIYRRQFTADLTAALAATDLLKSSSEGFSSDFWYLCSPWRTVQPTIPGV